MISSSLLAAVFWGLLSLVDARDSSNSIELVAGSGSSTSSGTGGPAKSAGLNLLRSVVLDTAGIVYVTEENSGCVRKFSTSDNIMLVYAGICSSSGSSGDSGPASSGKLTLPLSMFMSTVGVAYVADFGNNKIRSISASNIITTFAGTGVDGNTDSGKATSAAMGQGQGVWGNTLGVIYTCTDYSIMRSISVSGIVSLFAGAYSASYGGDGGPATSAYLNLPFRVSGDTTGIVYLGDSKNNRVRAISTAGIISTYAGNGGTTYTGEGVAPTSAGISLAAAMFTDSSNGDFYFSAVNGHRVFIINVKTTGLVTTLAGTGTSGNTGNGGAATSATLNSPDGIHLSSSGYLYVADAGANVVRGIYSTSPTIQPSAVPTTIAPSFAPTTAAPSHTRDTRYTVATFAGTGISGFTGTDGPATSATIAARYLWQDSVGATYIAEQEIWCVRKITTAGIIKNYAGVCGTGGSSGDNGQATSALFRNICGNFVDSLGVLYIAEYNNGNYIRAVSVAGIITKYAGTGAFANTGDGGPATSAAVSAISVWGDTTGNMYVATYDLCQFRKINNAGIISLFAGTGTCGYSGDNGPATSATVYNSFRVLGDTLGRVYLSDYLNYRVRRVSTSGIVSLYAGNGGTGYIDENCAATSASLDGVGGLAVDGSNGDVYIARYAGQRVTVVTGSTGLTSTFAGFGSTSPSMGDGGPATSAAFVQPDGLYFDSTYKLYIADLAGYRVRLASTIYNPTVAPSQSPSIKPTLLPTVVPSLSPTCLPTVSPSCAPSCVPTVSPTLRNLPIRTSPNFKVRNAYAYAGLTSDGAVMTWGSSTTGGDSSSVSSLLTSEVTSVVSSKNAFVAVKSDGSVVAWGRSAEISGWSAYATSSADIVSVVATEQAFAGVTSSGGVVAFGAGCCGGNVNQYGTSSYLTSDVKSISASAGAFCALKTDGSVYCWGNEFAGGGVSSVSRSDISGVVLLVASRSAFAAMTSSGTVVTWGVDATGGQISSSVSSELTAVEHVLSGEFGFAAYSASNVLHSWGFGGDVSGVSDVSYVAHSCGAFAALRSNGSVVAWGDSESGGDASSVSGDLASSVSALVASEGAFAAVTSSGGVVAWGSASRGGQLFANVSSGMGVITSVVATKRAFAALSSGGAVTVWGASHFGAIKDDGSAYGWGYSAAGLGSGVLSGTYSTVVSC